MSRDEFHLFSYLFGNKQSKLSISRVFLMLRVPSDTLLAQPLTHLPRLSPSPMQSTCDRLVPSPARSGAHPNAFVEANRENCSRAAILNRFQDTGHLSPLQVHIYTTYHISGTGGRTDLIQGSSERVCQGE